jgi:pimeloyl-ACP methyl ester carboxylesterase
MATEIIIAILAIIVLINMVVYRQVRRLLNFVPGAEKLTKPDEWAVFRKISAAFLGVAVPRPENDRTPADLGLAFETREIKAADDTRLEAWFIPHAQAKGLILLFHGYSVSKSILLDEARDFFDTGYSCLLVDFRGSGGSQGNYTSIGYYEAHDVAATYYSALISGVKGPVVLYGQSMGGAAILRAIDELQMKPDAIILEAVFDRLLTAVQQRVRSFSLPLSGLAKLIVMWGSLQSGFNGFKHNPIDYAYSVGCPTLFINGDRDQRVPLGQARGLYGAIPTRNKRFVQLEGAGHISPRADNPEQWRAAITDFLNSLTVTQ